ncbi:MAG: Phenylalanine--tRNA ligase [Patescibacteria group bacterium]|nr:Phenylalanine--tRNA ligase [Patescibacteria group bacterium]
MKTTNTPPYNSPDLTHNTYTIDRTEQKAMEHGIDSRTDAEASRIKRYLAMPDLSRHDGSPLHEIINRVKQLPTFEKFDDIYIPEIVPARESFDLFNFPPEHPARSTSDTYYVDEKNILRTHTTVMWYYYFNLPEIKQKIAESKTLGVVSYGKVYRKDEIDRRHMNIFHQIDGLFLCPKTEHTITQDDLKNVLVEVAQGVFGEKIAYRFNPDTFPYTYESLEMEVDKNSLNPDKKDEEWVEVLGAGIVQPGVLEKLGVDSTIYNGWAFGFGLERLAIISMELPDIRLLWSSDERVQKQLQLGRQFVDVSKYPPIIRDISFIVKNDFTPNNYFDLVRDIVGDLAEEVQLLDTYENEQKFGKDNVSYAYRITYRSLDRTLTAEEINTLHKKLEDITVSTYNATIR